ncbi:MAG: V-type ATP synthase subunit I [Clostridiaceae bacterium]|nr:V-type ATP synthase subunit I [Clostridiaceae bacterium]
MNKITVLGLKEERTKLLKSLMDLGVVEITQEEPGSDISDKARNINVQDELNKVDSRLSILARSIDILNSHVPVKKPLFSARRIVSEKDYNDVVKLRETVLETAERINSCEDELMKLKSEEIRLTGLVDSLEPWLDLDIPLDITSTRYTFCYIGSIAGNADVNAVNEEFPETEFLVARSDEDRHYIAVIGLKTDETGIIKILSNWSWNRISIREAFGTAKETLEQYNKKLESIEREREANLSVIRDLAREREALEVVFDSFHMERARIEAKSRLISTEFAFLMKGWLPAEHSEKIRDYLDNHFYCAVEIEAPAADEEFPVLLKNGPVVESISPVIKMYGVPSSLELDPSFITFPFYIFFFGLMLGDGGYGLIISLAAGLVLMKFRLEESTKNFVKLLFFCGLATALAGLLFGSWFGIPSLTKTALWIVPSQNPELMMTYSILIGIIHMYIGMFMKALNILRKGGSILDAVFDVGFIYIMLTGVVLSLLPFAPGITVPNTSWIVQFGNKLLVVGIILVLLTSGRKSKNIFGKIFGGLPKLYDIVSFFSDCLSYTRILALGLASAIIADIVNNLGMQLGGNIIIRFFAVSLVLLFGHSLNFILNVLGAYVHSCRLQFLEFFGKFLEGGGEAFDPLKARTEYIVVETELSTLLKSGTKSGIV